MKKKLLECIKTKGTLVMQIEMELVSSSYVATKMKNQAIFVNSDSIDITNFKLVDKNPITIWEGKRVISEKEVYR